MPVSREVLAFEARLEQLTARQRLFFVAGCCERLVSLHEFDGFGRNDVVARASETIWSAALGGSISAAKLRSLRKALDSCMPLSEEDPGYQPTIDAVCAILAGLDVVETGSWSDVVRVSRGLTDAYGQLVSALVGDGAAAVAHEDEWKARAVEVLKAAGRKKLDRTVFSSLPKPPTHLFREQA